MSVWLILVTLHAVFAILCFLTGMILLSPLKARNHPVIIKIFIGSLVGMIVFMVAATVSHWDDLTLTERVVFSGLPFLGFFMLYRAMVASKKLNKDKSVDYIDDIGFSLISLFNGFIIVALIDLSAPPLLIAIAAIAGTIVGSKYLKSTKSKLQAG